VEFYSQIKDGKLQKNVSQQIAGFIASCKDGRYEIEIKKQKKSRSLEQNNFIHLLLGIFAQELVILTGDKQYTMLKVKDMMKLKFLKAPVIDANTGEITGEIIRKTSELTTTELNVFMEDVIQYAAEKFHIVLPYPNEELKLFKE
jgi:DNA/RNA endonuclease YhcR with UshA esterase domain